MSISITESLALIDGDGAEHILTDHPNIDVPFGLRGLDLPPHALAADKVPLAAGSRLRRVSVEPRDLDLPLEILGADAASLRATVSQVGRWFNTRRSGGIPRPVRLRSTSALGDVRELTGVYAKGLEGQITEDALGYRQRAIVTLYCEDPYWYDTATIAQTYTVGAAARARFLGRLLPLRLSTSAVFAQPTVDNPGDAEAWPVWTIVGPGVNPVLRNRTTGETLALTLTLARGERLIVNCRPSIHPGGKTVTLEGKNAFGTLAGDAVLWHLEPGPNDLQLELSGATADSAIALTAHIPYLTA